MGNDVDVQISNNTLDDFYSVFDNDEENGECTLTVEDGGDTNHCLLRM